MVITDVNQVTYNGDGVTTAWPFTFPIIDYTDLRLTLINAAGARTDITSDYHVDMVNNTVYYPGYAPGAEPPEANQPPKVQTGEKLEIYRRVPVNQLADLGEKWPFNVIEKGLDKLTMICQDIYSWIGRNIFGLSEDGTKWDARNLPISNVGGPVNVEDAATKDYVDRILNGFVLAGDSRTVPFDDLAQMKSADIEAGQISFSLGYHDVNDGGAGVYAIRAKTPYDVENGGSIIFLDNGNVAELITDGAVNVKQFGAKGDGVTDDTVAFRNAINSGYAVYVPKGHYILTEEIENTTGLTMYGDGEESVLDFGSSIASGNYALSINGTLPELSNSIANVSAGSTTITFSSAHGLSVGDVFCIYNPTDYSWSGWREYYKAGEWCKVESITSATVVTVTRPLYDSYTGASVDIYKMNSVPVVLKDFSIIGTSSHGLLYVSACENVQLSNIVSKLEKYSCVYVDRCYGVSATNLNLYNKGTSDNDYGLLIGNCQNVTVQGGYYYGRRHGITTGGDSYAGCVPCRNINILNATLDNNPAANQSSNGFHGNIEDALISDCVIYNAVNSAGRNVVVQNCKIIDNGKTGPTMLSLSEMNGGTHIFRNNYIVTGTTTNIGSYGYAYLYLTDKVLSTEVNVVINDNTFEITEQSNDQMLLVIRNAKGNSALFAGKINISLDGVNLVNNQGTIRFIRAEQADGTTTDNSDYIIIDNIKGKTFAGSYYFYSSSGYLLTAPMRLQKQSGKTQVTVESGTYYTNSGEITYPIAYPAGKALNCSVTNTPATVATLYGNTFILGAASLVTSSKIRVMALSPSMTNVTQDWDIDLSWAAWVDEI